MGERVYLNLNGKVLHRVGSSSMQAAVLIRQRAFCPFGSPSNPIIFFPDRRDCLLMVRGTSYMYCAEGVLPPLRVSPLMYHNWSFRWGSKFHVASIWLHEAGKYNAELQRWLAEASSTKKA